ncbi:MAG: crossover junction endodeoxyribonuclease RuvC [Magnetococcales bacterium]|nr:crossover junction endodeoxyribonuclease RuvC [Magnetococcales bacterium]MBF0323264.1 crossover junction endodeoxyribonuclease RuvC [Magnetococcales bacterium]
MRTLGIDPGTTVTGWGIVEAHGNYLRHVAHGTIRTQAASPLPERLTEIFRGLCGVIHQHQPEVAAIESIFLAHNVQSAMKLGHARGAAIVAASQSGLAVHEYAALEVKKSVVGYGRAEKHQVQEMVRVLLGMGQVAPADAADALAVALCHVHQSTSPRHRLHP